MISHFQGFSRIFRQIRRLSRPDILKFSCCSGNMVIQSVRPGLRSGYVSGSTPRHLRNGFFSQYAFRVCLEAPPRRHTFQSGGKGDIRLLWRPPFSRQNCVGRWPTFLCDASEKYLECSPNPLVIHIIWRRHWRHLTYAATLTSYPPTAT